MNQSASITSGLGITVAQGRFTSPDPGNAGATPDDPQSWNMYAYGLNNPLRYVDPLGLSSSDAGCANQLGSPGCYPSGSPTEPTIGPVVWRQLLFPGCVRVDTGGCGRGVRAPQVLAQSRIFSPVAFRRSMNSSRIPRPSCSVCRASIGHALLRR